MDFLENIGSTDIDLLLSDLKLVNAGYEINYVIDASDIISYSFPYGIYFNKLRYTTPDDIGDTLIAYEYIFNKYNPILLDEYKLELILNRNLILSNNDKRFKSNLLDIMLAENSDIESIGHQLTNSSTFLLATALMQGELIKKFDDIYYNKLQIDELHMMSKIKKDKEILTELFRTSKRTDWSNEVFRSWVNSKGEIDYNNFEIIKEYKSTLRDFIAIDRLCQINEKVNSNKDLEKKYIFLYYSGANKSKEFFKLDAVKRHLPLVNGIKNYDILRTPNHSFLLFLVYNDDINIMIKSLQEFRRIALKKERLNSSLEKLDSEKDKQYFAKLSLLRRALIEKTFIEVQINQHKEFQNKIAEKIVHLRKLKDKKEIISFYQDLLTDAKLANGKSELLQTNSSYLVQGSLIHLIKKLNKNEEFEINKGKDLIKGAYHHLPILIFFDCKSITNNSNLESLYLKLVDYVITIPIFKKKQLTSLIETIKNVCYEIENEGSNKEYFYDILIKVFILLFIERANEVKSEVSDILEDGYHNLERSEIANNKWGADYIYTIIWLTRRINDLDKSDKFCLLGIKLYPDDPRFYHGKCLILYNLRFHQDLLTSCTESHLEEILYFSENAIAKYEEFLKDENLCRNEYRKYTNGSISALKNLILYSISLFFLEKLEKNSDISLSNIYKKYTLNYLRTQILLSMKEFENSTGNPDKGWAEFSHTEAVFELVEAIFGKDKNKIRFANEAIKRSLELHPETELYKKTDLKISQWMNKL